MSCKWIRISTVFSLKGGRYFVAVATLNMLKRYRPFLSEAYHSLIRSAGLASELRKRRKERKIFLDLDI